MAVQSLNKTSLQTTVVFADLVGSTGLFEVTGNAKAARAVTELTRWICEVFQSHGGYIVKTLGDGVLATFRSGQSAVNALVEMQRTHQSHISSTVAGMGMPIRAGAARGIIEMVEGDCYGDAVNVAARLSGLTGAHQIWVSSAVLDDANAINGVRFRPLGPISIRGRGEPCVVHQVEWKADENSDFLTMQADFDSSFRRGDSDFLGGQIILTCLDLTTLFKSFDMPIHIGRVRNVDFLVNDPRVSREHARIEWRNGSVVLTDISTYGTWVRFDAAGSDLLLRRDECVLHGSGEFALGAPFTDLSVPTVQFVVA